jgi:pimeloyl-ACP methyl ester carboxylesterase
MERFTNAAFSFEVTDTAALGTDGPQGVAILLHGFPQDRRCWDRVTPALAGRGYRVLAPDLRGYSPGARPTGRSAYRNSQLAADVLALADAAGAKRFHLAGHDWGAALSWYLAGRHPGRVASLAALSVPHPQAFTRALISSNQAARSRYMAAWQLPWLPERTLGRRDGQALRDTLVRTGLDPASADRYAARARDPAVLRGPLNWYRAMPFSLREPAGPIRVPTMFAWGNRDRFVSRAAAELCGRYVTGPYRFTELDGASHWLPEQASDQVATARAVRPRRPCRATRAPSPSSTGRTPPRPAPARARSHHQAPRVPELAPPGSRPRPRSSRVRRRCPAAR